MALYEASFILVVKKSPDHLNLELESFTIISEEDRNLEFKL